MQTGSGTTDIRDKRDLLTGPPVVVQPEPVAAKPSERNDDSGLHDIRNLAQSTKQRLSRGRITQNPPMKDDDVLASSSGSWKNIALPQPAKMVALPELEDLPSKQEVIAAQKAAAKARKQKSTADVTPALKQDVLAPNATANAALASLTAAPVAAAAETEAPPVRQAFTLPSMERKKSKGPLLAIVGLGVAAAAGGVLFMQSSKSEKSSAAVAPAQTAMADKAAPVAATAPAPAPTAEPIVAAGSAAAEVTPPPAEPAVEAAAGAASDETKADDSKEHKHAAKSAAKKAAVEVEPKDEPKVEEKKPEPTKTDPKDKKAGGKEGEGEPSFDALLKEAGVDEKKEVKPKLDKKSLSGDDFKKGMSSIGSKAQGCYKGTQGTATVKLTIAPSGQVTKVSVGGQFAGTPEGACVEAAVKGAAFPPWDGGPQSFNYSYMLSD